MIEFYEMLGVNSHHQFENKLKSLINNEEERIMFYNNLKKNKIDTSKDIFLDYFEEYSAERKTNKQDYTPKEVAELMSELLGDINNATIYDGSSGTGSLLIAKWSHLKNYETKFNATEYADNAIIYLIHNLAFRNIEGIVRQGDTLTQKFEHEWKLTKGDEYSKICVIY